LGCAEAAVGKEVPWNCEERLEYWSERVECWDLSFCAALSDRQLATTTSSK
jgi:hypothetical protein